MVQSRNEITTTEPSITTLKVQLSHKAGEVALAKVELDTIRERYKRLVAQRDLLEEKLHAAQQGQLQFEYD